MSHSRLHAIVFDAVDPDALAAFWRDLLGFTPYDDSRFLRPNDATGFEVHFLHTDLPRWGPNQMHFDLRSESKEHMAETIERATSRGARPIYIGQTPEEGHEVFLDPEGNEFCVLAPADGGFLAGCPFLGAVAADGTREVGEFWAAALDRPLVWDEGEETAIQATDGGPKINWGGSPVNPKLGKNRLHFDLLPDDQAAEVKRLEGLGARRIDIGQGDVEWVVMADPDGNEFCVL